jgi:AbrB family looped-hinge helix DNA binding protein
MNEAIMKTVKVSEKGQIAIPSDVQRMLGINKGDNLVLLIKNEKILLEKVNKIISEMTDDFKDMEYYAEESLKELWKNEPEGVWEQYLKQKKK